MKTVGKPNIKEGNKEDWTKITWTPDLAKFGMTELDDDIVSLFTRRAYDMAGCTHHSVKVRGAAGHVTTVPALIFRPSISPSLAQ